MKYSLGLDIGTTSVGWAVVNLDENRIEDLGVRIFEKPENPKDGKSLAEPRRTARSTRRRLRRRRQRLNYLKEFFIDNKLLSAEQIEEILTPHKGAKNPYELREKGLSKKLDNEELFIALYHIAKRRGYKSNRKSVEENDKETGEVLKSISENKVLLEKYSTVVVTLNKDSKFKAHKRNKAGDYSNSFIRENFEAEIKAILTAQQKFYPELTDEKIDELLFKNYILEYDVKKKNGKELSEDKIKHLKVKMAVGLFAQRPFVDKELIEKMRGKCPFEPSEPRAQKASITFEMFRLASDLAHLTYNGGQKLTEEEIKKCIEKCKTTGKVTYKAIRETLGYKGDDTFEFDYIRGKDPSKEDLEKDKFVKEKNTFAELKFYHGVKKALKDLPDDWAKVESGADLFDEIGYILTANKDDEAIKNELGKLGKLSDKAITELMKLSFSGFGHLSIKALRKITPFILQGKTYDQAVAEAGYVFNAKLSGEKSKLPPLNEDEAHQITNPVVKRAISQTIKVVNAVIRKYGAPTRIGLECAGDLAKNFKERDKIKKAQDENAAENEKIVERLQNEFGVANPTGLQITKFRFYNEQNGKCPYCVESLDINQLFSDEHYGEIDHIIPFSRCGNDGRGNKVLCHNECNQNKRNQTPYETWSADTERWAKIENFARATYFGKTHGKQKRLLTEKLPKEDWSQRAINDTRYISKFMSNFIKKNLKFIDNEKQQKVIMPAGGITSHMRRMWRIGVKNREENNLHHAVDAVIVALVDQGKIQETSTYSRWTGLGAGSFKYQSALAKVTDPLTGEIINKTAYDALRESILPWENFDKEVRLRTSQPKTGDKLEIWQDQFRDLYKDQDDKFREKVHPIFVSRMPKRNGTGTANQETIRSPRGVLDKEKISYIRTRLDKVTLEILENSSVKQDDKVLYEQLKTLLEQNGNDPKKAFAEPVYKGGKTHDKNGKPLSPVSTIKVDDSKNVRSGFLINNDKQFVNNGDIIRADVYKFVGDCRPKSNIRYKYIPIYMSQLHKPKTLDDTNFEFVFSLYKNDYFVAVFDNKVIEGYFNNYPGKSRIVYTDHTSSQPGNKYIDTGKALAIRRHDITVLGDNYKWS
ncbi:type II CRISPR RNA-guided endonuclease Cas9 [Candidatus Saccharibacteria bacterium]|nr:type II CRISPR RNA-guided endonuclease Cas9 [Candidatus Saccharibacteria bacterium]